MLTLPARRLLEMERDRLLEKPLPDLAYSLLHMAMNRWFRSKNRTYE